MCCLNTLGFSKMCRFIIDMSLQKDLMISGKMTFWYTCNCVFSCHKYVTWQFRSVTHRAASWHIISRKIWSWLLYSSCWYSLPRDKHFRLHRAYAIACLNCLLASPTVTNNYFQNNKQSCNILNILKLCKYVIHMCIHTYIHTMKELPWATVFYEQDIVPPHESVSSKLGFSSVEFCHQTFFPCVWCRAAGSC